MILPGWNSHATVAACLESLRCQTFRDFETILVDSSPGLETEAICRERFPEIRYHHHPTRLSAHGARNLGVKLARGGILVFSDPDCRMSPVWLERLEKAFRSGHRAAGGSVGNLEDGWFPGGVHIAKYAWWLPGGHAGPRPDLPSANVAYAHDLFDEIGPFPEQWCGDTLLARRAAAAGVAPWFDPAAEVLHDHRATWGQFLRERFERGCDYGLVRPRLEGWSRARLLAYALAAPLIAGWMTLRALRYAALAGHLGNLLWCLPVVAAGYAGRQAGEAAAHWRLAWRRC